MLSFPAFVAVASPDIHSVNTVSINARLSGKRAVVYEIHTLQIAVFNFLCQLAQSFWIWLTDVVGAAVTEREATVVAVALPSLEHTVATEVGPEATADVAADAVVRSWTLENMYMYRTAAQLRTPSYTFNRSISSIIGMFLLWNRMVVVFKHSSISPSCQTRIAMYVIHLNAKWIY